MTQPHAGKRDWDLAIGGVEFPASLSEIMKRARDVGGIDHEVHEVIGRLQNDSYESYDELVREVRDIYLADGLAADKLPL